MIPCRTLCVDLIVTYTILSKVRHTDNKILTKELQLLCVTFINPETVWFEISEVPIIDQYSYRIYQTFNEVWLSIYPRMHKVIFSNGSEFKRNLIPLLKAFAVKPTCTTIKIHSQMIYWREFIKSSVACSRPNICPTSHLTQLPRGLRLFHLSCMHCDAHIISRYKLPLEN